MNSNIPSLKFTVRCVSDIKQETMKESKEIEFKIPEGYVIDNIKSTDNKIVCKKIEPEYPKSSPIPLRPNWIAVATVVPLPTNGSNTILLDVPALQSQVGWYPLCS